MCTTRLNEEPNNDGTVGATMSTPRNSPSTSFAAQEFSNTGYLVSSTYQRVQNEQRQIQGE